MPKHLINIFLEHDFKESDKWEHYILVYHREVEQILASGAPVNILEVGVQNGGSLEVWAKYLPMGSTVLGVDIDAKVASLHFTNPAITVAVADATDLDQMERLLGNRSFDIIVDDGSHRSDDIVATFGILFRYLAPGGRYVIEDLHCSYWPEFGGGYAVSHSAIEWLKRLVDTLNADHIRPGDGAAGVATIQTYKDQIARVSFYDSIAVVEKLPAEKTMPYRRLVTGQDAVVQDAAPWHQIEPVRPLGLVLFGQAAARRLDAAILDALEEARARAAQLQDVVEQVTADIEAAKANAAHRDGEVQTLLAARDAEHAAALDAALAARDAKNAAALDAALTARDAEHTAVSNAMLAVRDTDHATMLKIILAVSKRHHQAYLQAVHRMRATGQRTQARSLKRPLATTDKGDVEAIFDSDWYKGKYPDAGEGGLEPLDHFIRIGAAMRYDPSPLFDTGFYLTSNPDVATGGFNPLLHYLHIGASEGRRPRPPEAGTAATWQR